MMFLVLLLKAKWVNDQLISFLAGLKITGTDELGIVNNITKVISNENNVNMRSINFDTDDGIFEGTIMIYVHDTKHLNHLIDNLKKVKGVNNVQRIDEKIWWLTEKSINKKAVYLEDGLF